MNPDNKAIKEAISKLEGMCAQLRYLRQDATLEKAEELHRRLGQLNQAVRLLRETLGHDTN